MPKVTYFSEEKYPITDTEGNEVYITFNGKETESAKYMEDHKDLGLHETRDAEATVIIIAIHDENNINITKKYKTKAAMNFFVEHLMEHYL